MSSARTIPRNPADLRRLAERRLLDRQAESARSRPSREKGRKPKASAARTEADAQRVLHELQVHQIELEMQNAQLLEARQEMEVALDKYTDLYDFAPVGYFSVDDRGAILEVNLTGAALLGVDRSQLLNRRLLGFVASASRPVFLAFLARAFNSTSRQVCEALLQKKDGGTFWADLQAVPAVSPEPQKWCRLAVFDISALKRAEEAQRRVEALGLANRELKREITRRQEIEKALQQSQRHTSQLLAESLGLQARLRELSRQVLSTQDEERKRISRELHDVIAQTLTGVSVRLAALKVAPPSRPGDFTRQITLVQKLLEKSISIVHGFARKLRPAILDDLGLVPALHSFLKTFARDTGIHASMTAFVGVEKLDEARRTALYRVAQEALSNVARHARASQVQVSLRNLGQAVALEIRDDGRSFDAEKVLALGGNTRLGLLGMKERVEMVGGTLRIQSAPGQGTTVTAEVPFGNVLSARAKAARATRHHS